MRPVVNLKRRVSPDTLASLELKYNVTLRNSDGAALHAHPHLDLERQLLSTGLVNVMQSHAPTADEPIADVFGNERATSRLGFPPHHSIMPLLCPSDATRWSNAEVTRACQHLPLQCSCKARYRLAFFVHSIYYISPEDLADFLVEKTTDHVAYSIAHVFQGIAGNFYSKEMKWHRARSDVIRAIMDEGNTDWTHPDAAWRERPYYIPKYDAVLITENLTQLGETHLQRMRLVPRGHQLRQAPVTYREWTPAMTTTSHELFALPGAFTGDARSALNLTSLTVKQQTIYTLPLILVFARGTAMEVVCSKDVIAHLTLKAVGQPRTPVLYQTLMRLARAKYLEIPNIPQSHLPRAVLYSVILSMESMTSEETVALSNLVYAQTHVWDHHTSALALEPHNWYTPQGIAASAAVTTVSGGFWYNWWETPSPDVQAHVVAGLSTHVLSQGASLHMALAVPAVVATHPFWMAWSVVSTAGMVAYYVYDRYGINRHNYSVQDFLSSEPGELPLVPPTVTMYHAPVKFMAVEPRHLKAAGKVKEGCVVKKVPVEPREERNNVVLHGIGFSVVPTVYQLSQESLVNSISSRIVAEVPKADDALVAAASSWWRNTQQYRERQSFVTSHFKNGPQVVREWAAARYNGRRTEELVKAYEDFGERSFCFTKYDLRVTPFVKSEKQVALKFEEEEVSGVEKKNPRPILAHSDAVLASVCPLLVTIEKGRKEYYAGEMADKRPPGICPSGISGEEHAEWTRMVEDILGDDMVVIESDGSKWDAHMGASAMREAAACYCGDIKATPRAPLNLLRNPGPMKGGNKALGVKFSTAETQQQTGAPWTGAFNGAFNELVGVSIIETGAFSRPFEEVTFCSLGKHYFLRILGDDHAAYIRRSFLNYKFRDSSSVVMELEEVRTRWEAAGTRMGHTLKCVVRNIDTVEWCSKYSYPLLEDGRKMRYMGAKIGRALVRSGWLVDSKDGVTLYSALKGGLDDNYHVPFLREYLERTLELVDKKKGRSPRDQEHVFHMSRRHEYDDVTWEWMQDKYGLGKSDLESFKEELRKVTSLPATVGWDVGRFLCKE